MIRILKYLKGYLRIRVWGFSPERFLNLCGNRNILVWDIVKDGEVYYMCISLKGFYGLKEITRKTGTRVVICERYGLPFFVPRVLARKAFVAGLILTISFWIWTTFYIWEIELDGNLRITEDVFQDFLQDRKVVVGMPRERLDIASLEKEIRREFPEITWTSAKLTGTKLQIDVKENDAPILDTREETNTAQDLITQFSGTVTAMVVRRGIPMVAVGDTVEAGTVLISGKVPVFNEDGTVKKYTEVEADGDIELEYRYSVREKIPVDYIKKEYSGRTKTRYFFRWGNREWKLPGKEPYQVFDTVTKLKQPVIFEKLAFPVFLGSRIYREYRNVEYVYSANEAREILYGKVNGVIRELEEKGAQTDKKSLKISMTQGAWIMEGIFSVRAMIEKTEMRQ